VANRTSNRVCRFEPVRHKGRPFHQITPGKYLSYYKSREGRKADKSSYKNSVLLSVVTMPTRWLGSETKAKPHVRKRFPCFIIK
jgi:hypothetical protein